MQWYEAFALMIGMFAFLLAIGVPVAITFLTINFVGAAIFFGGDAGMIQATRGTVGAIALFALIPIPLFLLMGEIMFRTGMASQAISAIDQLITRVPGRLSLVAISSGTVFSALTGSSIANTAMLGSALMPEMSRRGYHSSMSMGPILGTGGIAVLIPPSGLAVLLGSLASIPIADLLIGGIGPGLAIAIAYVVYVVARVKRNPQLAPSYPVPDLTPWERWRPFLVNVVPLLGIFVVVVGSILTGHATPTESAALGSVASIGAAIAYRRLTLDNFILALRETAKVTVMLMFIIAGSVTFAQLLGFSGAIGGVMKILTAYEMGPYAIVFLMLAVLLVLGCFVDPLSMMMLTLPFLMPLARAAEIDLVWFGILMLIGLEISFITPPFGLLLFVMRGLAPPGTTTGEIYSAALPFFLLQLLVVLLIIAFPVIATGLPDWLLH